MCLALVCAVDTFGTSMPDSAEQEGGAEGEEDEDIDWEEG